MLELVTILIPTHNRHQYLKRILEYYKDENISIIVADSTKDAYISENKGSSPVQYFHLPAHSLPAKLEWAINKVETPYVVMCSDDDFTVPGAIYKSIEFLKQNKDFIAAQGNCISYSKKKAGEGKLVYSLLYEDLLSYRIASTTPFERLEKLFSNYRTLFTAVHYTENLRFAFKGVGDIVKNLFLNEYLTAIIPIVAGKYAELPVFFQVREYAEDSDDKTTDGINKIMNEKKYLSERENFLKLMTGKVAAITGSSEKIVSEKLSKLLIRYAETLTSIPEVSGKKKIGQKISKIPLFGNWLIKLNRKIENKKKLNKVIKTLSEREELMKIESIIKKYSTTIS